LNSTELVLITEQAADLKRTESWRAISGYFPATRSSAAGSSFGQSCPHKAQQITLADSVAFEARSVLVKCDVVRS